MDSLIDRIEDNHLDALYLFINDSLRDRATFDRFFDSLMAVLPHNWSIQRVELGHEFLSMAQNNQQDQLFNMVCNLEAIRTLIISDGYVPRKDMGSIQTQSLLSALPRASNLLVLDLQRLRLADADSVDMLSEVFHTMADSLEEVRITGLFLDAEAPSLDSVIEACTEMTNLKSLAISTTFEVDDEKRQFISHSYLKDLCQNSTTLQDLSLRAMHLDDEQCRTIASALATNNFLTSLDIRQNAKIGEAGYKSILEALERNYDLWCSVTVDNDSFQGKFSALIELNQANRGDLLRNPTRQKLEDFLAKLHNDPTAVWYFLTIHDSILFPFVAFLKWKGQQKERNQRIAHQSLQQQPQQQQQQLLLPAMPQQLAIPAIAATVVPTAPLVVVSPTAVPAVSDDMRLQKKPRLGC